MGEEVRFLGILNSNGVQTQVYTGALIDTLNAAKWQLLSQDRQMAGWVMNPLDLRTLEMLRENGNTGAFLLKFHPDIEGFLGAPVVTSLGLPTGTALTVDWTSCPWAATS
ncbi:phage major capsid family protein [Microbacterium proteolyticum]|jgi:HK97 family phage major capsid protein|uniref:phage major capsid family protein n=1 Tax=Microbacterium proteolyticum TaxID=1572644 RepID=UPI0035C193A6